MMMTGNPAPHVQPLDSIAGPLTMFLMQEDQFLLSPHSKSLNLAFSSSQGRRFVSQPDDQNTISLANTPLGPSCIGRVALIQRDPVLVLLLREPRSQPVLIGCLHDAGAQGLSHNVGGQPQTRSNCAERVVQLVGERRQRDFFGNWNYRDCRKIYLGRSSVECCCCRSVLGFY